MNEISIAVHDAMASLEAMKEREKRYQVHDYLSSYEGANTIEIGNFQTSSELDKNEEKPVDLEYREILSNWCFRVIDHFTLPRHVAATAMNFVDRFCCKHHCNREVYRLVATTSLYLALKLEEGEKVNWKDGYSQSHVTMTDIFPCLANDQVPLRRIIRFETLLLRSLAFHVHPPLPAYYIQEYLTLLSMIGIQEYCTKIMRRKLESKANYFAELASMDYSCVTISPSLIALASILNALEQQFPATPLKGWHVSSHSPNDMLLIAWKGNQFVRETLLRLLHDTAFISQDDIDQVLSIEDVLWTTYHHQPEPGINEELRCQNHSPVNVTAKTFK